jgi:hypothetical protein
VWDRVAAVTEVEGKPSAETLEGAMRRLLEKYAHADGPHPLDQPLVRYLKALMDVERASICRYRRQWLKTALYLIRSFSRVPRITVHLCSFWRPGEMQAAREPHGEVDNGRVAP